ncbi:MAG: NAD(P)H-dependent oxidoreductase [Pseudomonadota bacterium]
MTETRLLGISGSLRAQSTNTLLVHEAARAFAPTTFVMGDIRLPLFDEDLETSGGIPEAVEALAAEIKAADAIVISTPEYNKNLSGSLKNALDWVSRVKGAPWAGKPVAVLSAAAGRAGGERAQYSLRHCLVPFRPRLIPGPEVMIAGAGKAFGPEGRLLDEKAFEFLGGLMSALRDEVDLVRAAQGS